MTERPFDVVLYGATGFTGRQTAHYFARHAGDDVRWAIAGRNASKLDALKSELQNLGAAVETIVANSKDRETVDAMVSKTRVLLTTAGPFDLYGPPVVESCVEHNTDYVDITGETPFVRKMINLHHEKAEANGTKIVPFCGFDSVPSDLGTWMVASHLRRKHNQATRKVQSAFTGKGGFNGGTLASALNMARSGQRSKVGDVLLLNPETHKTEAERRRSRDMREPRYDERFKRWLAPFFMAPINTRVVRRTNALLDIYEGEEAYGPHFTYAEGLEQSGTAAPAKAWATTIGSGLFDALLRKSAGQSLVEKFAPNPGEGPSDETMDNGFFRCRVWAEGEDGAVVHGIMQDNGDPGNRVTVKILCESALALALQRDMLPGGPTRGGILTPAVAFGDVLLERLRNAGMKVEITDEYQT